MSVSAPDLAVRSRALEAAGSFSLEAPAGSGKTDLLTARFLRLLATVDSPRQILALTYTRKAADEMQARILGVLRRARGDAAPSHEWDAFLLDLARAALASPRFAPDLLENPEAYRVGTFHSFCASLVRGWPLEAGVPPGAPVMEDLDQRTALETSVDACFRRILAGSEPGLAEAFERRLAACDGRLDALREQVVALLAGRDRLLALEDLVRSTPGGLQALLTGILEQHVGDVLEPARRFFEAHEAEWRELKAALESCGAAKAPGFPAGVPGAALGDIAAWKGAAAVFITGDHAYTRSGLSARTGHGGGFSKAPSAAFIASLAEESAVVAALAEAAAWPEAGDDPAGLVSLANVMALATAARRDLSVRIPGAGLDYLELELAALRALRWEGRAPSESLVFFGEHLRHLLVDEAQDMNDVQARILGRLLEGWEPGDGRTVFVVGDPKQSIYRFRRADVALFEEIRSRGLPRESEAPYPLRPLSLTANFRSEPALVRFCNALFERVMASPRREVDEVPFQPSKAARGPSAGRPSIAAAVFVRRRGEVPEGAPAPREFEAAWVAARVADLHAREPASSVALLFPARSVLAPYVQALGRAGVPLRLLEGEDLASRPEVRHLRNLFAALARPVDDVAWAGALRAPWCRLSSAELLSLARGEGFWSRRVLGEAGSGSAAAPFAEAASRALATFGREPYELTLGRLWEDMDGPCATAAYYGAAGVANARAFLSALGSCAGYPAEEALQRLDRLMEQAYTPPDPAGAFSPVQVMTVHRAKGLEFDHVFAVSLDRDPRRAGRSRQPPFRMARFPVAGRPTLAAARDGGGSSGESLAYHLLRRLDEERGLAESRRLFYVACTRARRTLTLTGVVRETADGVRPSCPVSPLGRLWSAAVTPGAPEVTPPFRELGLVLALDPEAPSAPRAAPPPTLAGPPPNFDAQPLPYLVRNPSRRDIEEETALAPTTASEERDPTIRARGVVLHRIFETLARGRPAPEAAAVASALAAEGVPAQRAARDAPGVLAEARAAWDLPSFASLRASHPDLLPEWGLEDFDGGGVVRVGRVDLAARGPGGLVLVDYKAGRPDADTERWLLAEQALYRPQLRAYAEMARRCEKDAAGSVRVCLLFTAVPVLVEL